MFLYWASLRRILRGCTDPRFFRCSCSWTLQQLVPVHGNAPATRRQKTLLQRSQTSRLLVLRPQNAPATLRDAATAFSGATRSSCNAPKRTWRLQVAPATLPHAATAGVQGLRHPATQSTIIMMLFILFPRGIMVPFSFCIRAECLERYFFYAPYNFQQNAYTLKTTPQQICEYFGPT